MEIRETEDRDIDSIRELFKICFAKELSREEWDWKYKHSPWGSYSVVAVDNGNVVAHYGGIRLRFHFGDRIFNTIQPCDVMTHPRYRAKLFSKRGLMIRVGEFFYTINPMDFAFGFPSERHAVLGTRQLGYTKHNYVTILKKRYMTSIKHRRFWPLRFRIERGWENLSPSEIDSIWDIMRPKDCLSIEKKAKYILWRYRNKPYSRYEPFIIRERITNKLAGFCIFFTDGQELSVCDLLYDQRRLRINTFLRILDSFILNEDIEVIKFWINQREDIFRAFINEGYEQERGIPYLFKVMNKDIEQTFLFENYFYRMGDYDAV